VVRRDNDAYYTLQAQTAIDALVEYAQVGGHILEPCVGRGHLVEALRKRGRGFLTTNDIDPEVDAHFTLDVSRPFEHANIGRVDWVVTNPPFSKAFEILKQMLPLAHEGVALLLRLSFLEPTYERGAWLAKHPPDLLVVTPRFSFTGDGKTDSVTTAWYVWYTGPVYSGMHTGIRVWPKKG
jgi:hypothetical protein